MRSVTIVGIGRLGGALAIALSRKGIAVDNLIHRGGRSASEVAAHIDGTANIATVNDAPALTSDIVLITTTDPEIVPAAGAIAGLLKSGSVVLHTSGSLSSNIIADLHEFGVFVGSMHPLISISDPLTGSERFAGAYFCIEGDVAAIAAGQAVAKGLDGIAFEIATAQKPLYHAAAVTACGHLVALVDVAVEMLTKCGLGNTDAKNILTPLIKSTVENIESTSLSKALTGSYARGDVAAVDRHLASFRGTVSAEAIGIYLNLAERSLEIAERIGVDPHAARQIRESISIAKRNYEC